MALEIRTTPAILGIQRTPSNHSIEQPQAEWNGSLTLPIIHVEGTVSRVTIDQEDAFNESGLKNNEAFRQDSIAFALQKMAEGTSRRASQGDALAKINEGGDPIPDQALQNAYDQFLHEFGMVTMPRSGAKIDVIEGTLDIQVIEGEINGEFETHKPIIDYQPSKVERYMEQYNSISITYLGESLDFKL